MRTAFTSPRRSKIQLWGVAFLRQIHLLPLVEQLRLWLVRIKSSGANAAFILDHPDFIPPPAHLMHDAYAYVSYAEYIETGTHDAGLYGGLIKQYHPNAKTILEWGCGPLRILRHMPAQFGSDVKLYGMDYNPDTIAWCKKTMPHVSFALNGLAPPLPTTDTFDAIYAISVLTHLSLAQQQAWIGALRNALNPGGLLIMTTHGERHIGGLLPREKQRFYEQGFVIRGNVVEGKRCYVSYHHPDFAKNTLFKDMHLLELKDKNTYQDIWVLQKLH